MKQKQQDAAPNTGRFTKPAKPKPVQTHEVRIIGGTWKRTKLPVANKPGLRPTPDRVRETLFNWLGQDLRGWRCVDAFAGTGVLGFEAASRGAKEVLLVELDGALVAQLKQTQVKLQADAVQVLRGDGVAALRHGMAGSAELIFLDPPFDSDVFEAVLLAAARVLSANGFIYLEAPRLWSQTQLESAGLFLHRHLKAGAVHAHLLRRSVDNGAIPTLQN